MSITQNFCALLLHRIGTWTLESPWLCTTWPSSMRMAAVGMVFLSTTRGKFFLRTMDMVAVVSSTTMYLVYLYGYLPKKPHLYFSQHAGIGIGLILKPPKV